MCVYFHYCDNCVVALYECYFYKVIKITVYLLYYFLMYRSAITNPATLGLRGCRIIHFSGLLID